MPEPMTFKKLIQARGKSEAVQQSIPTPALEAPEQPAQETEHVSIFHLVHAMEDMLHGLGALTSQVHALVQDNAKSRNFVDTPINIGATLGYTVGYLDRKYLFIYSASALTLAASDGTTKAVPAHTWVNISYPRGTILTIQGGSDTNPTMVVIRACDLLADVGVFNLAQVNGAALSATNPVIDADQIRALIMAGQGFDVTTGLISSSTNANLYGGLEIFANTITKNIFIYFIDILNINTSGDDEVRALTAQDPALNAASPPTPQNLQPGNSNTSLATIYWSGNNFTAGSALPGNLRWQGSSQANIHQYPITIPGDGFLLKAGTTEGIGIYNKIPTAGNTFAVTARYVEF